MNVLPPLLLRRTDNGRIVTNNNAYAPAIAVKNDRTRNEAIIFEVREPAMGRSDVDEARIMEIGKAFLKEGKEIKGFLGVSTNGMTNVGVMSSRFGTREDMWYNETTTAIHQDFADKLMGMCSEMFMLAKVSGLVPKGRNVSGELIRFDVQYRSVTQDVANDVHDDRILKISGFSSRFYVGDSQDIRTRARGQDGELQNACQQNARGDSRSRILAIEKYVVGYGALSSGC